MQTDSSSACARDEFATTALTGASTGFSDNMDVFVLIAICPGSVAHQPAPTACLFAACHDLLLHSTVVVFHISGQFQEDSQAFCAIYEVFVGTFC
jgi:hypothetical protein